MVVKISSIEKNSCQHIVAIADDHERGDLFSAGVSIAPFFFLSARSFVCVRAVCVVVVVAFFFRVGVEASAGEMFFFASSATTQQRTHQQLLCWVGTSLLAGIMIYLFLSFSSLFSFLNFGVYYYVCCGYNVTFIVVVNVNYCHV